LSNRAVLDGPDILRALRRISHEILEANEGPENLVILGIPTRGVELARRVVEILQAI
jgi:pyrimidine operon attenuation protein/uracil phosphoribosyltransferase